MSTETTISGVVRNIVFYNQDNGYTVCDIESNGDLITVVGNLPYICEGENVEVQGSFTTHKEYGEQFRADSYSKSMPKDVADIVRYLSSGIVKGVGLVTAERIVEKFGEETLNIMANDPGRLREVKGISPKKAEKIGASYAEQIGVRDLVIFLQKYGISVTIAVKVHKKYGMRASSVVKENPYILADDIVGIGFITADKIAESMGFSATSEQRIVAGVRHALTMAVQNGHTYLPRGEIAEISCQLLAISKDNIETALNNMLFDGTLEEEEDDEGIARIYLPPFYYAERNVARRLLGIANSKFDVGPDSFATSLIEKIEQEIHIQLAPAQKEAVYTVLQSGAVVITGGPGTGKTTIINTIIKIMERCGKKVALCAPTGRAAKRMTELCGVEAKTVHRLLEMSQGEGANQMFAKNDKNPLDFDVIIVDEMSMTDMLLMNALLRAVKEDTLLIMVGDVDQLPPVGAGDVLRDTIDSGVLPVVKLTEIFRQAKESMIVVNAHKINKGGMPTLNSKDTDFFLVQRHDADDIVSTIVDLCKQRLPSTYGLNPISQIQVLAPMRRSSAGVNILNTELQNALNPPNFRKREQRYGNRVFREGDKVMQIKNNYSIKWARLSDEEEGEGVFNGDIGYIQEIDSDEETVTVLFDEDKVVYYDVSQLDELELAYAVTVHKSQGSEFHTVVMPMFPVAPMLQNRNLLYTAITRAKKMVVLVGREQVVRTMVDNVNDSRRYSGLKSKLVKLGNVKN